MKIVATTKEGFLLSATEDELKSILVSFGMDKPIPSMGLTIPAGDFNTKVNEIKNFGASYEFRQLMEYVSKLNNAIRTVQEQLNIMKPTQG